MQGKLPDPAHLDDQHFDEGQFLGDLAGFQSRDFAQFCYMFLAQFCCLVGRHTAARAHILNSKETLLASAGQYAYAEHHFIEALVNILDPGQVPDGKTLANCLDVLSNECGAHGDYSLKGEFIRTIIHLQGGWSADLQLTLAKAQEQGNRFLEALATSFQKQVGGAWKTKADMQVSWAEFGIPRSPPGVCGLPRTAIDNLGRG